MLTIVRAKNTFIFIGLLALLASGCPWGPEQDCQEGEEKLAADGCNTCFCDDGTWACTKIACPDPEVPLDAGFEAPSLSDSGINLPPQVDSGISPEPEMDSGISPEPEIDSGISPEPEIDSGISPEPEMDSGISPGSEMDSGISSEPEMDSGISSEPEMDSGISSEPEMDSGNSSEPEMDGGTSSLPTCVSVNFNSGPPGYTCPITNASLWPERIADVAYGSDPLQKLDVYIPDTADTLPLIIWIHGGGWHSGDKYPFPCFIWEFTQGEYVVASLNYRLTDDTVASFDGGAHVISAGVPWPAQIADVKQALRFLRANASDYQINPEAVGVIGSSAGGHLTAMMATTGGVAEMRGDLVEHLEQGDEVQAAVDMFGPVRADLMDTHLEQAGCDANPNNCHVCTDSPEYHLMGCTGVDFENCTSSVQSVSPLFYLDGADPPIIVAHGDADCSVPINQSELLVQHLQDKGVVHEFIVVSGAEHDKNAVGEGIGTAKLQSFFDGYLRGCQRP